MSGSGISWAICKSAPRSSQITTPAPHHSVFYRPDALPAAQPTASKHWRQIPETWSKCLHNAFPCSVTAYWPVAVDRGAVDRRRRAETLETRQPAPRRPSPPFLQPTCRPPSCRCSHRAGAHQCWEQKRRWSGLEVMGRTWRRRWELGGTRTLAERAAEVPATSSEYRRRWLNCRQPARSYSLYIGSCAMGQTDTIRYEMLF